MIKKLNQLFIVVLISLILICIPTEAEELQNQSLQINILYPGTVRLSGNIAAGDRIQLFRREYHSAEHMIMDSLLSEKIAETNSEQTVSYSLYDAPLTAVQIIPDFDKPERDIEIKALYAVIADDDTMMQTGLVHTDCSLDTGVVNQYWCNLAGSKDVVWIRTLIFKFICKEVWNGLWRMRSEPRSKT